jgi:hypothetical protein
MTNTGTAMRTILSNGITHCAGCFLELIDASVIAWALLPFKRLNVLNPSEHSTK